MLNHDKLRRWYTLGTLCSVTKREQVNRGRRTMQKKTDVVMKKWDNQLADAFGADRLHKWLKDNKSSPIGAYVRSRIEYLFPESGDAEPRD